MFLSSGHPCADLFSTLCMEFVSSVLSSDRCSNSFFFIRLRRILRSTLFPYTTLFRSRGRGDSHSRRDVAIAPQDGHRRLRDRKSTRLNSSHLVISYAVFCLKTKKIYTQGQILLIVR